MRAKALATAQLAAEKYKQSLSADLEIKNNKVEYEETTTINNDPNQSGIFKFVRGLFYKDKIAEKIENEKAGDELINSEEKFWEEYEKKMSKFKIYDGNKKGSKTKTAKTPKKVAEEYFPPGSVAEIQKRLAEIDKALSKATGDKQIADLKNKRIAIAKELAEAEKKIQIQSFQDQISEEERQWNLRYQIARQYGDDVAKAQFPDLKGDSYFDELNKKFRPLNDKYLSGAKLSDEDLEKWEILKNKLDALNGVKDPFTNFTDNLDLELSKLKTFAEKQEYIQKQLYSENILSGKGIDEKQKAELIARHEELTKEWSKYFDSILEEQKSFEEKFADLQKEYDSVKISAKYQDATPKQKESIDKYYQNQFNNLSAEALENSKVWQVAFGNLEYISRDAIKKIIQRLEEFRDAQKKTLSLKDFEALQKKIRELKSIASANPFKEFIKSFEDVKKANEEATQAQAEYNENVKKFGQNSEQANKSEEKYFAAQGKKQDAMQSMGASYMKIGQYIGRAKEALYAWADAFGGLSDAAQDTVDDITGIMESLDEGFQSYTQGDVVGMVLSIIKTIGLIIKAFNGEKKKERQLKSMALQLGELKLAYDAVAYAAEKAFGSGKYDADINVIRNLEEQQRQLEAMWKKEDDKKKSDKAKLTEYKSQIQAIQQQIQDLKDKMVEDVLQTNIKDSAKELGDALVEAFEKGEDAAKSLDKVANDMIKNLLKNQLNLMLQNRMKPILDNLLKASGFNADGTGSFTGLTPEQIALFKAQVAQAGLDMQGFLSSYSDIFSGIDGQSSSLSGAIKGISEETASVLAGQMNAMRIMQAEALKVHQDSNSVLRLSLTSLTQIEINTRYNKYLELIYWGMKDKGILRGIGKV